MSENSIPEGFKMTEVGHLPKVWDVVRFGDKGQFQYGYTTSATDENTGTKFLRITDIKEDGIVNWGTVPYGSIDDNNLQKFRLSKADILFARIGATTGKTCIIGGAIPNAVFASYLIRFVPDKELHPKYVFYFTQTREYQELVNAGKEGKLKKGLSATELKNFNIPFPPLPEQQKIAEVLSTVQQAKEKTDAVISATNELKKSLMKHLFTYGPISLEKAENVPLKKTEIGLVPEAWAVENLDTYCNFTTGKLNSNQAVPKGVYPFFTCSPETYRIDKYSFDCEAVLLAGNNARGIYSVKYYSGKFDAYQRTYVITIKELQNLEYKYLKNALETRLDELRMSSIGTSTKFLTLKILNKLKIPLPPLPTQQEIASILSAIDKKIEVETTKRKSLNELFKSLLHNLMTGKLRVTELQSNRVAESRSL